ncbi:MAG: hypothetical protein ACLQU2_01215 [Candidatus Binataceae bacterium]
MIEQQQQDAEPVLDPEPAVGLIQFWSPGPSKTTPGKMRLQAEVFDRATGTKLPSPRVREVMGDLLNWLLDAGKYRAMNGPEISERRLQGEIDSTCRWADPRECRDRQCREWRAGRTEVARFFGLLP